MCPSPTLTLPGPPPPERSRPWLERTTQFVCRQRSQAEGRTIQIQDYLHASIARGCQTATSLNGGRPLGSATRVLPLCSSTAQAEEKLRAGLVLAGLSASAPLPTLAMLGLAVAVAVSLFFWFFLFFFSSSSSSAAPSVPFHFYYAVLPLAYRTSFVATPEQDHFETRSCSRAERTWILRRLRRGRNRCEATTDNKRRHPIPLARLCLHSPVKAPDLPDPPRRPRGPARPAQSVGFEYCHAFTRPPLAESSSCLRVRFGKQEENNKSTQLTSLRERNRVSPILCSCDIGALQLSL